MRSVGVLIAGRFVLSVMIGFCALAVCIALQGCSQEQIPNQTASGGPSSPRGMDVLSQMSERGADGTIDWFIDVSVERAERFREEWLQKVGAREAPIESLAKLMTMFVAAAPDLIDADLTDFQLESGEILAAFRGDSEKNPDAEKIYGPFAGQWHGKWEDVNVDHEWGVVHPGLERQVSIDGVSVHVASWQYAWIGDGYGLNLICRRDQDSPEQSRPRQSLLGYVEHIGDGDMQNVTAQRPHVGIFAGEGRIIWITAREVFFERLDFVADQAQGYTIVGFEYEMTESALKMSKAFSAYYQRDEDGARRPFRSESCNFKVAR